MTKNHQYPPYWFTKGFPIENHGFSEIFRNSKFEMALGFSESRQDHRNFDAELINILINDRSLGTKVRSRKFVAREGPASCEAEERKSQNDQK